LDKKINKFIFVILTIVIFICIAAKKIALFLIFWPIIWIAYILIDRNKILLLYNKTISVIIVATTIYLSLYATLTGSEILIAGRDDNSWQQIKLFDLCGISVRSNELLLPEYVTNDPIFNEKKMREVYLETAHNYADKLILPWNKDTVVLPLTHTKKNLNILYRAWVRAVLMHPTYYIQHRFSMYYNNISRTQELHFLNTIHNPPSYEIKQTKILKEIYQYCLYFINFSPMIYHFPFVFIYAMMGIFMFVKYRDKAGFSLFMISLIASMQLLFLFANSMASEYRYIYLAMTFVNFSHPIAIICFIRLGQKTIRKMITNPESSY
jgi:hypothetical protein